MPTLDLTPFGFTPTEGRIYQVLLAEGPGTGYAVARRAGLARANAYAALEGLVAKGAARKDEGRAAQYRAESPSVLLARVTQHQASALEQLRDALAGVGTRESPAVVEVDSPRAALQLLSHDIARAGRSVQLLAPADAFPLLAPVLRRAVAQSLELRLVCPAPVALEFVSVSVPSDLPDWPGEPLVSIVDDAIALVAARQGARVTGHWTTAPILVAAARLAFGRWGVLP